MTTTPTPEAGAGCPERVRWGAVGMYVAIAYGAAWLVVLPAWFTGGLASPLAFVVILAMMYTPLIAAFVTSAVMRAPGRPTLRGLGWWPLRPVNRLVSMSFIGIGAMLVILGGSAAISIAARWMTIDPEHSMLRQAITAAVPAGTPLPPIMVIAVAQLANLPIGIVITSLATLGEETGWRGFLLPALRPLGTWPAVLLTGTIWGLWHAPVILLGYDFDRPDSSGLGLMMIACMLLGVPIGWLRIRSGTIWPSVLAHATINSAGPAVTMLASARHPWDPALVGALGASGMIVCAVITVVLVLTRQMTWVTPDPSPRRTARRARPTPPGTPASSTAP